MRLSSIQSIAKDLAETAVMAHWIAPSYATPRAEGLTILENLCPPRADGLLVGGLFAGAHILFRRAFHAHEKSELTQFALTVFSGLTCVAALTILPIQTNDFADPYYDLVLKLVGVVAIKTIGRDIIDRALDVREEVKPHKVYNYVAIGSVAGIVVHFYAFTGACYLSQTLSSHWMKAFWPLAVTFTLTLHFLFLLIVDCKSTTLNATMLASASLPSALMNMGFPYQSTLIIASAIATAIWELKIFAARQAQTQIYPTVRNDRTSELEIHT